MLNAPPGSRIDLGGLGVEVRTFHRAAEQFDLLKLFCVEQRVVEALRTGFENGFLMNGFGVVRETVVGRRPRNRAK